MKSTLVAASRYFRRNINSIRCFSHSSHGNTLRELLKRDDSVLEPSAEDDLAKYLIDWTHAFDSRPGNHIVCLPKNTDEVSTILRYCFEHDIEVVPQGGNTGLCGGAVPHVATKASVDPVSNKTCIGKDSPSVVLSLEKMNRILSIDTDSSTLTCEAGTILESANNTAKEHGLMVPLDLGAKGSCMIGGNVSTNAGGLRVLRYGSMFQNVLGVEVVLANGEVLNLLRPLRKNNTGYHLKNLFIGSEGTLGVVTKVCMNLVPLPQSSRVIFFKLSDFQHVPALLRHCRSFLGDILSAFEFIDTESFLAVKTMAPHLTHRLPSSVLIDSPTSYTKGINGEVLVLVEVSGGVGSTDDSRLQRFIESAFEKEIIIDGVWSEGSKQEQDFWAIRENVPVSLMQWSRHRKDLSGVKGTFGKLYKYDVTLSLAHMNDLLIETRNGLVKKGYNVFGTSSNDTNKVVAGYSLVMCCFGHAGDENLHLNVLLLRSNDFIESLSHQPSGGYHDQHGDSNCQPLTPQVIEHVYSDLNEVIYTAVERFQGSFSAEHGIGQAKVDLLEQSRPRLEMDTMKNIKHILDPKYLLNPNKVLQKPSK